jgi:S-DNA-T family DNA segregation ATPase FtsK/SpoIIIE
MLYIRYTDDPSTPLGAVRVETGAGIVAQKANKRRNRKKVTKEVMSSPVPSAAVSRTARRRMRQIALLGGVLGITYLLVAMVSYSPTDPAFSHTGEGAVRNVAGPLGAWLADVIFQVLGYGAWFLAGLLGVFALKLAGRPLGGWLTALAGGSGIWAVLTGIALVVPGTDVSPFPAGGLVGELSSGALSAVIGPAGSWIVVLFTLFAAAPFILGIDWEKIADGLLGIVEGRAPSMGAAIARRVRGMLSHGRELRLRWMAALMDRLRPSEQAAQAASAEPSAVAEIPVEIEGMDDVPTPTIHAPLEPDFLDIPPAEEHADAPEDRTLAGLPELVEAEWEPTFHGMEEEAPVSLEIPIQADAPDIQDLPTETTSSGLDAALLGASAVEDEVTGPLTGPGIDPLDAPEPGVSSAKIPVEVVPGAMVAGTTDGGGLAVVAPKMATPFELPHLDLLDSHKLDVATFDTTELQALGQTLEAKLADFGVRGSVVAIRPGPVITTFEYLPSAGVKISKIAGLQDDIAMALKALRVRIVAPIPGKGVVGIEIPNKARQTVWFRDMLGSDAFRNSGGALPMALGKTVEGHPRVADLAKMPHLLVGGTTGSGKSVAVNSMLVSMLYSRTPEELRLILIDPKMLEFELYRDIPHLLHPVVTQPRLASAALKWACTEMDARYQLLSRWQTRNIASYNAKVEQESEDWNVEKARRYAPEDWPADEPLPAPKRLPYIVIVIDELADLMMVAAKDVEESIIRIAQKARAAGIHLIVATQRPSVNVITGLIKANMPSRVAFQVRTKIDGRTILDQNGAEALLGKGDMLFLPPGVSALERLHGPFVSDEEVRRVTEFLRQQGAPSYDAEINAEDGVAPGPSDEEYDELYDQAVAYICQMGKASSSMIQREFKIGYNRAARIIEIMEREGVIGAADGARPRAVLVGKQTG